MAITQNFPKILSPSLLYVNSDDKLFFIWEHTHLDPVEEEGHYRNRQIQRNPDVVSLLQVG